MKTIRTGRQLTLREKTMADKLLALRERTIVDRQLVLNLRKRTMADRQLTRCEGPPSAVSSAMPRQETSRKSESFQR